MDQLENKNPKERPDLCPCTVDWSNVLFHSLREFNGRAQSASNEKEVEDGKIQVCVFEAPRALAEFSKVLCDDLDDDEDRFHQWIL